VLLEIVSANIAFDDAPVLGVSNLGINVSAESVARIGVPVENDIVFKPRLGGTEREAACSRKKLDRFHSQIPFRIQT
jgi:hypothetical protein